MHLVLPADKIRPIAAYAGHSTGYRRASMVNDKIGSVHSDFGLCAMDAGGAQELHVHSFEEMFHVLEGEPVLVMEGRGYPMSPGACGVVPLGVPHAWVGPARGTAKWLDTMTPQPRDEHVGQHTFFLGPVGKFEHGVLDIRDPRSRHFFRMADDDIQVDKLKIGARVNAPKVSSSMATALLAYSGIAVKMLVDQRLDAIMANMFMVEYQPGGCAHPHDHPFEETYYFLEGEVEAVADDVRYTLKPGDLFWTAVGSVHAFYNTSGKTVRWLETQAPQPPARHSYRFARDWEYLAEKLAGPAAGKADAAQ
jgi:mannose-6-phosphate isomerase-like protein (cupin superfamily)